VTFTALVAASSPGSGTPTGTVTFRDGATVLGMADLDASGLANLTYGGLGVGGRAITAAYAGDTNYLTSLSTAFTQAVSDALTATVTAVSSTAALAVTFTATVQAVAPGVGTPTGAVTFLDGTTVLGAAELGANGQASLTDSGLELGGHGTTAVYAGDANFVGGTSDVLTQVVSPDLTTTTTTLTADVDTSVYGPTVVVVFLDGDAVLGYGTLDAGGVATFLTAALGRGSHTITAVYSGDASFTGLNAVGVTQTVL
jgi:hypothetical protein